MKKREFPYEVFRLASSLLPHLSNIFEECEISPMDLFVLSHIKHFGKDFDNGLKIFLRADMTDLLKRVFRESDSAIAKNINKLRDRDFLAGIRIRPDEKKKLFGKEGGRMLALVLREPGLAKIDEFSGKVGDLFIRLTLSMPAASFSTATKALEEFAEAAIKRVDSL
ncbi:MAG: hypothetical protein M3416_00555 [Acidobacteriota bacterium]|nr:hypothetical protein [Acidobacteriota bacterium]